MEIKKQMNDIERRLFKEAAIREYQLKRKEQLKNRVVDSLFDQLRKLAPFNIVLGIAAIALLVYLEGIMSLVHMLLFGLIWLTLISSLLPLFLKNR
jgi:hypothetical protein